MITLQSLGSGEYGGWHMRTPVCRIAAWEWHSCEDVGISIEVSYQNEK
jgi:hypothetical protein